LTSILEIPL